MGNLSKKRNLAAYVNERNFPFIVQIAVPEGGFGSKLDAINAWHRYSKNNQRRGRPQSLGEKRFWRGCFKDFETADKFKQRFGGEVVPGPVGPVDRRGPERASLVENISSDTTAPKAEASPCG
jgi:hypothetical protein